MKPKHTNGEWKISQSVGDNYNIEVRNNGHYGNIVGDEIIANVSGEANAKLMAAAPELLEASAGLLEVLKHYNLDGDAYSQIVNELKQAINKATK